MASFLSFTSFKRNLSPTKLSKSRYRVKKAKRISRCAKLSRKKCLKKATCKVTKPGYCRTKRNKKSKSVTLYKKH